jgi:peptidyl-prolyl cis-trans isomerase C
MNNRSAVSPVLAAGVAAFLCAASGCGQKKEAVLAQVGSESITSVDFQQELSRQPFAQQDYLSTLPGRKELLELMVRRKVMLAESHRQNLENKPDIKQQLHDLEAEFRRQMEEAKERLVVGEYFRSLQQKDLKVSDEEVRSFWEKENEVRASHILFASEDAAKQGQEALAKGEKFEVLAKKISQDPASAARGGDLGFFMSGTLIPEFEKAVFSLKVGETSGIVRSPYGYHIIRKTGERKVSETPYDKIKDVIRSVLEKRKFQAWIDQAKDHYKISMNLPALEALPGASRGPAAQSTGGASRQP